MTRNSAATLAISLGLVTGAIGCSARGATHTGERVVCVSKQINEFLYAIGAQGVLVGRDLTSIYPPAIRSVTSVGYHRALSAEGIVSLRPTMFLTDGNVGPQSVLDQVRQVGIPIVVMPPGESMDSAQLLLASLGQRFHRQATADSVLAAWRSGLNDVWRDTAQWAGKPKPRVLFMHFGQIANDYLAIKRGGPADQILRWAGGENAIDSVGNMMRLTPELIAKAAPDVIIATDVGFDRMGSAAKFATMPGVALTPAGRSGRIYRIDETEIMYFGPRTPATVRKLAALLHP